MRKLVKKMKEKKEVGSPFHLVRVLVGRWSGEVTGFVAGEQGCGRRFEIEK